MPFLAAALELHGKCLVPLPLLCACLHCMLLFRLASQFACPNNGLLQHWLTTVWQFVCACLRRGVLRCITFGMSACMWHVQ